MREKFKNIIDEQQKKFLIKYPNYLEDTKKWNTDPCKFKNHDKNIEPRIDDIFLVQPVKDVYFYGRIIGITDYCSSLDGPCYYAVLYNCKTRNIDINCFDEKSSYITRELLSLDKSFFEKGYLLIVGDIPSKKKLTYGFLQKKEFFSEEYILVDKNGGKIYKKPNFITIYQRFKTLYGIKSIYDKAYYADRSFYDFPNLPFDEANLVNPISKKDSMIEPFVICNCDGKYSLTLDVDNELNLFESRKDLVGNGYDHEELFKLFINEYYPQYIKEFKYDSEADMFCLISKKKTILYEISNKFIELYNKKDIFKLVEKVVVDMY